MEKIKSEIATTSLVLTFTILATIVILPIANAHDPPLDIDTYAYLAVQPDPVGVDQTVYISMWIDKVPPTAAGQWGMRWHDFELTITKPDGNNVTLGPYDSDAAGGAWDTYVPDQTGTYEFVFSFPGQIAEDENPVPEGYEHMRYGTEFLGDNFLPSTSNVVKLTVQQDKVETAYPSLPFPSEYWERPIHSMNRDWYSLGGNWLGLRATTFGYTGMYDSSNTNFNPYSTAPESAHVIWTKPIAFGGQIGGEFGAGDVQLYATGTAYEAKFSAVILYGILYYHEFPGAANNPRNLKAVDLRTGETLWSRPLTSDQHTLKVGMIYNFKTGNQYGGHAYLFSETSLHLGWVIRTEPSTWSMYDAMTGDWILDIANASAGTLVRGPDGEVLSYNAFGGMLTMWNASKCIEEGSWNQTYMFYSPPEVWRPPQGATIDWNGGIEWSVPVSPELSIQKVSDDVVVMSQSGQIGLFGGGGSAGWRVDTGYNAKTGELLWGPINRTITPWTSDYFGPAAEGVYTDYNSQERTWNAYNITTGEKLWGPSEPRTISWSYYDRGNGVIGYGNLYSWGLDGEVYCFDLKTGNLKWKWSAGSAGVDSPYGVWPLGTFNVKCLLADGKLYVATGHDYTPPVFKGAKVYCIDADSGDDVWSSLLFSVCGSPAVADGYMLWVNAYDNQIYCYGKGPTKTTVDVKDDSIPLGEGVMIKGRVIDESPGTKESLLTARFPNGVPAISDEDQSGWMEYLYQQQLCPEDITGVKVRLTAVDSDGSSVDIGTVTTDGYGMFKKMWTPENEGEYSIIATFEGSESYWTSYAETAIGVGPAPDYPEPPTADEIAQTTVNKLPPYPDVPSATEIAQETANRIPEIIMPAYLTIDLVILVIAAIGVIIGLIAYMTLRKQK